MSVLLVMGLERPFLSSSFQGVFCPLAIESLVFCLGLGMFSFCFDFIFLPLFFSVRQAAAGLEGDGAGRGALWTGRRHPGVPRPAKGASLFTAVLPFLTARSVELVFRK